MGRTARTEEPSRAGTGSAPATRGRRLAGVDAARGLALIGLMSVHILPAWDDADEEPTWSYILFSGDSAALFALLAGVGLALTTGGRNPHAGRDLARDRVGLTARALLIALVGLGIGSLMPEDAPNNILIYYGVFFLLALPFLGLGSRALFAWAAGFGIGAPVLIWRTGESLPDFVSGNPTLGDLLAEPGAMLAQLLLTGTYPALTYATYLLAGLGVGRLDLRRREVQLRLLVVGLGVTVLARVGSYLLLHAAGGYQRLLDTPGMDEEELAEALLWGPDDVPGSTAWWLVIDTPHSNTPFAIAASLGVGLAVLGFFLLVSRGSGGWLLPLSAMGGMTLSLYTAHLVALSLEVHYDRPYLWFAIHLAAAVLFAVAWRRSLGQGPLERGVGAAVHGARRLVPTGSPGTGGHR